MNKKTIERSLLSTVSAVALILSATGCDNTKDDNPEKATAETAVAETQAKAPEKTAANDTAKSAAKAPAKPATKDAAKDPGKTQAKAPAKPADKTPAEVVSAPVKVPAPPTPAEAKTPENKLPEVVVTVNGKKLSRKELDKEMKMITDSPQFSQLPPQQADMYRKQFEDKIVDRFINQTILLEQASKKNIEVGEEDIDAAIKEIKNHLPANAGSLEDAIKEHGMTMDELRKNLATDLKIRKLLDGVVKDATNITDKAASDYYNNNKDQFKQPESVHARHILVKVDPNADEKTKAEKKAEIEGYRKQLLEHPEDFAKLAKEHSDCPSGQRGGDLGTFSHGQMVPAFDKAAFEQKKDEIGTVIETRFGYHIIQVLEHNSAGELKFDEVKERIKQMLAGQNQQKALEEYLANLKKDAKITYGNKK